MADILLKPKLSSLDKEIQGLNKKITNALKESRQIREKLSYLVTELDLAVKKKYPNTAVFD